MHLAAPTERGRRQTRARVARPASARRRVPAAVAGLIVALLSWGCDKDLSREYAFTVRVTSEPGRAVRGARASLDGEPLGVSDASGAIGVRVRGREGDILPIEVGCPEGHRAPPALHVPLRHLGGRGGASVSPEFTATCTPTTHALVVAVRAERGPHLPLLYLGRELARTDASGAAHLALDVASEEVVELVLDTTEQPRLRPRSPVLRIQPGARDQITAIDQDFTLQPLPTVKKKAAPRRGPIRLE